jgi:hypothetical protein
MKALVIGSIIFGCAFAKEAKTGCSVQRKDYEKAHASVRKCLGLTGGTDDCRDKLSAMIESVKAVHDCLPQVPPGHGTGGGYEVNISLKTVPACKDEADELKGDAFYHCLANWNFAAHQMYRLELPKEDCLAELGPFLEKKTAFESCMREKAPGARVNLNFSY